METTQARVGMSLQAFLEAFSRQPFELINGEIKPLMPNVAGPSYVAQMLFLALVAYLTQNPNIEPMIQTTFIRPDEYDSSWVKGSRIPDVMVMSAEILAHYRNQTPDWKIRPYPVLPSLVVEVVSPTDRYSDVDAKVDQYLTDAIPLIWVIDPQQKTARVYVAGDEQRLRDDAILNGGQILPGFEISLSKLFE